MANGDTCRDKRAPRSQHPNPTAHSQTAKVERYALSAIHTRRLTGRRGISRCLFTSPRPGIEPAGHVRAAHPLHQR
jgi:hypothetical protein